jgi:tRNA A-37 threonylcarbamoyl transferase component Bud32
MNKSQKILSQGAEAVIFLNNKKHVVKDRIPKSYRIPEIDNKIRRQRTKSEIKLLIKASQIINSPIPQESKDKFKIIMPLIEGKKLSEHLDTFSLEKQKSILGKIGESVAKLHKENIIHGDLTTSNMILVDEAKDNSIKHKKVNLKNSEDLGVNNFPGWVGGINNFKIFFIDFGLGFFNGKYEDKAVDIHLLKQALEAKHFKNWQILFEEFIKGYKKISLDEAEKVLTQLQKVEKRGRYKH